MKVSEHLVKIVAVAALIAAGYYVSAKNGSVTPTVSSTPLADGRGGGAANESGALTPVVTARARRGDIGVYIAALGSVTPIYNRTGNSRVDGELVAVRQKKSGLGAKGRPALDE